ncbi:SusC/RagA family TonB-linked outer membrane protein [Maribellus comscasis]|uniref:SusC/RagA family TonB-linked outer membrane protein n=1 Tax=Maribellus comscasis TaxID=2681766 RepID=A0A6I6JY58_9BACT|nr:TonB-dependent receptor [Maribellus comscasis]QGY47965.1 SusC/RagA family TonB-linked outer membrane protein [Maribellus comscasis]
MKNYLSKDYFDLMKPLLRKMKITLLVFLIFSSSLYAINARSQVDKINIAFKNAPVKEVLDAIETQTDYLFVYDKEEINLDRKINIHASNRLIDEVLIDIFENTNFTFKKLGTSIILMPDFAQQQKTISGKVTDLNNVPLPGVTIIVKGTTQGAITDTKGNYSLVNVPTNSILVFSFIGMKPQEISVAGKASIDVIMEESAIGIEEVVAIGYGTIKKRDLTGSVTSVKADNIEKINTASLNDALQGLAAGVQVTSQSGQPGEASNIIIRGGSSISASNEPLYVIDGFPQLGGDNMDLNPQDIESVEVLKDASAGAIYGARASNGVIIITTKSGKKGTLNITYNGKCTVSNIIKKLETVDIVEYATIQKELASEEDAWQFENPETWADSTSIDWQDAAYRKAVIQTHNLQINGGSERTQYSSSVGYFKQEGIAEGSEYYRVNARLKIDSKLNDKLKAGTNLSYSFDERDGASLSGEADIGRFILIARPYIVGGNIGEDLGDYLDPEVGTGAESTNPLKWLTEKQALKNSASIRTTNYLEYRPVKGLTLRANGAMAYSSTKNKSYLPSDVGYGRNYNGIAQISQNQRIAWLYENTADYKLTIGKHKVQGLGGFSAQSTVYESMSMKSTNFPIENLGADNIGLGTTPSTPVSGKWKSTIASFFGRVNYNYADRYLLTASVRADGSSNFGINNKWGTFPSGAFAWRASEEEFIKALNIFSNLKFRLSYGITGNNSIGNYASMLQFATANISINSTQNLGLIPGTMANEDLKWEQNEQADVGIDIGFFNNRLNITADYYHKKSIDLLLNAPVPYYSGFSSYTTNVGDIESYGYEFDINGVILNGKLKWTSSFNISFPSTKVLRLSDADYFFTGSYGHKSSVFIVREGDPLGSMYGYVYDGVNQNEDEATNLPQFDGSGVVGGPRYKDVSGPDGVPDGVIDSEYDRTIIGNGIPDWFGGFTNQFSYKNFDFSFVFSFRYGNDVFNANKNFLWTAGINKGGVKQIMDAWTPENPTNELWAWGISGIEYNNVSSWLVEDGSFLRLQNVTIGYNLSKSVMRKVGIKKCRVFLSGDKLLTFSKYSGYDPEVSVSSSMLTPGVDFSNYPHAKSVTFGINLTF